VRPIDAGGQGDDLELNLRKVQADLKFLTSRYLLAVIRMWPMCCI